MRQLEFPWFEDGGYKVYMCAGHLGMMWIPCEVGEMGSFKTRVTIPDYAIEMLKCHEVYISKSYIINCDRIKKDDQVFQVPNIKRRRKKSH